MTKKQLGSIINDISKMDKQELHSYAQKVYLSKEDINPKAFKFIQRAIDIQLIVLRDETTLSPMVVMSEIKEGDM